jgi:hypothetical protein
MTATLVICIIVAATAVTFGCSHFPVINRVFICGVTELFWNSFPAPNVQPHASERRL